MAVIKLGTTKAANKLIRYCEKKAELKQGINCNVDYAKTQFKATRELWGKNDKIQSHHTIQSFKPNEVSPEKANEIGKELAEKIAPNFEACIYTHADQKHIHNHIVINSVNPETGKKLHLHGKNAIEKVRGLSDQLCKKHDLSIVKENSAKLRYTFAEKGILEKGQISWKDQIREKIDLEKGLSKSMKEFKNSMEKKYNIEVKENSKNIIFKHPDNQKFVRGSKLGMSYEREGLKNEFERNAQRQGQRAEQSRDVGNQENVRYPTGVHQCTTGQGRIQISRNGQGIDQTGENGGNTEGKSIGDIEQTRESTEQIQRELRKSIDEREERVEREQRDNIKQNEPNRKQPEPKREKLERDNGRKFERTR